MGIPPPWRRSMLHIHSATYPQRSISTQTVRGRLRIVVHSLFTHPTYPHIHTFHADVTCYMCISYV